MSHAPAAPDPHAPPPNPLSAGAARFDRHFGTLIESIAAAIVLVEIAVLFAGVVARYVFHSPLVWSDELASIFFLWLSMLGAVVALRRGEHMRMTALVNKMQPGTRALLDTVAIAASLAFLAMVMWPAYQYAEEEAFIVTPALEISNAWRAAAIPIGMGLMALAAVLRLLRNSTLAQIGVAVGSVAVLVLAFWLAQPLWATLGKFNLIVFFVGVVATCVFAGVPIAFSFALASFGYLALTTQTPMLVMVGRLDEGMSHL
ncbi:MAG: C4-dicarboxylate transport system permease DctM subunit, partial [Rhodoferax sp.]|nr:C4-dicarboxylate transport system permease DctM subunit [Rhodoferax sp.]